MDLTEWNTLKEKLTPCTKSIRVETVLCIITNPNHMMFAIRENFERVEFGDAVIKSIVRHNGQLVINLTDAYLENFIENDIDKPISPEEPILTLNGIISERFSSSPITNLNTDDLLPIDDPEAFLGNYHQVVSSTRVTTNKNVTQLSFAMIRDGNEDVEPYFIEWTIAFTDGKLEWDKYKLH